MLSTFKYVYVGERGGKKNLMDLMNGAAQLAWIEEKKLLALIRFAFASNFLPCVSNRRMFVN